MRPRFEEVFLFHNFGKLHVSSCGALAWQVRTKTVNSEKIFVKIFGQKKILWDRRFESPGRVCLIVPSMSLHNRQRLVQVQEKRGEKYEALTTKGGHEILLVVSWYEGFLACNNEGSPNQVT